jgi:hypothetical protein
MTAKFSGGVDLALKVPPHQFDATVAFYRDSVPTMSQAELWLELYCDDFARAAEHLARAGVTRCDPIEPLPPGFRGGWITSPANIVHMVREPDAW